MENSNQTWNTVRTCDELFMIEEEGENLKHKGKNNTSSRVNADCCNILEIFFC